jgi:hypothetical protein
MIDIDHGRRLYHSGNWSTHLNQWIVHQETRIGLELLKMLATINSQNDCSDQALVDSLKNNIPQKTSL